MPNVYAQSTKIANVGGRSEYINDQEKWVYKKGRLEYIQGKTGRQEEVVLNVSHMTYPWSFYAQYEKDHQHQKGQKQTEAREIIVALPNGLAGAEKGTTTPQQKEELKKIITEIAEQAVGPDYDWEAAVHWNHSRSNLHFHLIYSTRPVIKEAQVKRYGHDIWMDKTTHSFAKANSPNAVLVHRKGDIQTDSEGKPRFSTEPLGPKDPKFKLKSFNAERDKVIQSVLDEHGYHLEIQDRSTPYLSQRKLYKYSSAAYKKAAGDYNEAVKDYNAKVREHLSIEPEKRPAYIEIRHDVEKEVRKQNAVEKKISAHAVQAVKSMTLKVQSFVRDAYQKVRSDVSGWWSRSKDIVLAAFRDQVAQTEAEVINDAGQRNRIADTAQPAEQHDCESQKRAGKGTARSERERLAALRDTDNFGRDEERKSASQEPERAESESHKHHYRRSI